MHTNILFFLLKLSREEEKMKKGGQAYCFFSSIYDNYPAGAFDLIG
jgi:hypothetical protein